MEAKAFDKIKEGVKNNKYTEVEIGGRKISFEPDIPSGQGYRAITNTEGNGFTLASDAFISSNELKKTILHELHRLNFSQITRTGSANSQAATSSTRAADEFANRAYQLID